MSACARLNSLYRYIYREHWFHGSMVPLRYERSRLRMIRESTVERYLVRRVKELGGLAIKLSPAGMTGLPDRLILLPGARVIFAEVKRPGEKPRPMSSRSPTFGVAYIFSNAID